VTHLEALDRQINIHNKTIEALHARIGKKFLYVILFLTSVAIIWMLLARVEVGTLVGIMISIPIPTLIMYELLIIIYDSINSASKTEHNHIKGIKCEIHKYEQIMMDAYNSFPKRDKGATFKNFHSLRWSSVEQIEELLPKAMFNEHREVSVTIFIRNNIVVRSAANLGNMSSVRITDNMFKWNQYADDKKCKQIYHYHNHPGKSTDFGPSEKDLVFFKNNKMRLDASAIHFRCFIICWNLHLEWKIIEFSSEKPDGFIVKEYDVVDDKVLFDNLVSQPAK
jgi:hypothetical protein